MTAWHAGYPAVCLDLDCNGETHRVGWTRGHLALFDHDLASERALVALGAEPCACLATLRWWRGFLGENPTPRAVATRAGSPSRCAHETPPEPLGRIAEMARVVRAVRRAPRDDDRFHVQQLLLAELRNTITDAISAAPQPGRLRVRIRCRVIPPGAPLKIDLDVSSQELRANISLSLDWVYRIWGRRIASVDGHVVLAVLEDAADSGGRLGVVTIRWNGTTPAVGGTWLHHRDGSWHVDDQDPPAVTNAWWSVRAGRH